MNIDPSDDENKLRKIPMKTTITKSCWNTCQHKNKIFCKPSNKALKSFSMIFFVTLRVAKNLHIINSFFASRSKIHVFIKKHC